MGSIPTTLGISLPIAAKSDDLLYAVMQSGKVLEVTVSPFGLVSLGNIGPNSIVGLDYFDGALYAADQGTNSLSRIDLSPLSQTAIASLQLGSLGGPTVTATGTCGRTRRRTSMSSI